MLSKIDFLVLVQNSFTKIHSHAELALVKTPRQKDLLSIYVLYNAC
jgi:hypothetical protein